MKQIMKRAHELAKQMEGDYVARLALALRQAWQETKALNLVDIKEMMTVANNRNWTAREWERYGKQRIYFNFKGRGEGFATVVSGRIASVDVNHSGLQRALGAIVGKAYRFGA